jgi:hypothetical protein
MILLQNNKLVNVTFGEDDISNKKIYAERTVVKYEELYGYNESITHNQKCILLRINNNSKPKYCFKVLLSHYTNNKNQNNLFTQYDTIGEAIVIMQKCGYVITINGEIIETFKS